MKWSLKSLFYITFTIFITYYMSFEEISVPVVFKFIDPNLKYILLWTKTRCPSITSMLEGQHLFLQLHCPVNNCYVTTDRMFMTKLSDFDVILFHGPDLKGSNKKINHLLKRRAPHQQYVFTSKESAQYYPITNRMYDNFFNWTWTYRLTSDLYFGYIIIRDKRGSVIGPKKEILWLDIEEMKPIEDGLKRELSHKKVAAAWLVSNCVTLSKRELYVRHLKDELGRYNMTLDIYGKCGKKMCPRNGLNNCHVLIKKWYYFYLAFENSFSEDYVTEKLLTALLNNAVPVVYGDADYTRFLPDGAYLDARQLGIEKLVQRMFDAITNIEIYYDFFRWRNHYTYHNVVESIETNYYCKFCSKVNGYLGDEANDARYLSHFRRWWVSRVRNKPLKDLSPLNFG